MIRQLIIHQWREMSRSPTWRKTLFFNIFISFLIFFFLIYLLGIGIFLYFILKTVFPEISPLSVFNQGLLYYLGIEMTWRFYLQKVSALTVQPYLHLPLKKTSLIHFLLGKSLLSLFNLIPVLIVLPFAISATYFGANALNMFAWFLAVSAMLLFNHFLVIYLKQIFSLKPLEVILWGVTLLLLIFLDKYGIISLSLLSDSWFTAIYQQPFWAILPILLLFLVYHLDFQRFRNLLYLDKIQERQSGEAISRQGFSFLKRFGRVGELMALELQLIWRNKRPRSLSYSVLPMILIYPIPILASAYPVTNGFDAFQIFFAGIFITGFFVIAYAQLLFNWKSSFFDMLLTGNIDHRRFITAQYLLMMLFMTVPYAFFFFVLFWDPQIFALISVAYLWNMGINLYLMIHFSMATPHKIALNETAYFNWQGSSKIHFLMGLLIVFIPVIIYSIFYLIDQEYLGLLILGGSGLLGVLGYRFWIHRLVKRFFRLKYLMAEAYREMN